MLITVYKKNSASEGDDKALKNRSSVDIFTHWLHVVFTIYTSFFMVSNLELLR
jgi:hypothetical protein